MSWHCGTAVESTEDVDVVGKMVVGGVVVIVVSVAEVVVKSAVVVAGKVVVVSVTVVTSAVVVAGKVVVVTAAEVVVKSVVVVAGKVVVVTVLVVTAVLVVMVAQHNATVVMVEVSPAVNTNADGDTTIANIKRSAVHEAQKRTSINQSLVANMATSATDDSV